VDLVLSLSVSWYPCPYLTLVLGNQCFACCRMLRSFCDTFRDIW